MRNIDHRDSQKITGIVLLVAFIVALTLTLL
jgi:hypothetical protein